jgi:proteasome beta subunit
VLFNGKYQGSSFAELLQVDHPHLLPGFSAPPGTAFADSIPHGTTVLGFKFADGVLMAGDRLATEGHRVASREVEKVFQTDEHSLMAISGAAGPSIEMARLLCVELEHYEKIEGESLELDGKANRLSNLIRQNLPAAMQGLVVVPLYAGYDLRRRMGRLWKYDITGGRYEETDYEATGSGGLFARESLKNHWSPAMSRAEAVKAAIVALTDAADEDRATGGIDLQRRIYSIIKLSTASGTETVAESEIDTIYRELVASRGGGNG